ncbi:DNA polymerase II [Pseudoalteromonas sp. T1lg65]|uniref:DNA polymerase II n=1 Tax=Pseudoalteromonas sp. T1lg65 TaxID=2077101 RepID=UPI003F7AD049
MAQAIYQGFILSRQQLQKNGKLHLCYWLKTASETVKVWVENEQALFFVPQSQVEKAKSLLERAQILAEFTQPKLKHFNQQPVQAIKFSQLKNFYDAKSLLQNHVDLYEEDIRHADRYLMERFIRGGAWVKGNVEQRDGYLEITEAKLKPCNDFRPTMRVLSIDIECNLDGVLFSIGLAASDYQCVIMIGQAQQCTESIIWVEDEIALLETFVDEVQKFNPDVLIGWNVIDFDAVVLDQRAQALGVELTLGKDGSVMQVSGGNYTRVLIAGRVLLDGIDTMKNATYHYETFKLSFVAEKVLGQAKLISQDDRVDEIIRMFKEDKVSLARYNLQDCKLVLDIFSKLNLLDFAIVRTELTGLELERMGGSVAAFTNLYLPLLHRSGYIAPNLGEHGLTFESPGGYVMDSKPGLYKNILVLDFKSLYPSIIQTFFIDPMGLIEGLLAPKNAIDGFDDGVFSRTAHHLPKLVKSLAEARQCAKSSGDMMLSQAIKIIMNSLYGVLGSKGCRFYDPRLSSSITKRGHEIMQQTRIWIEELGYEVIYGDTDSTFVKVPEQFDETKCNEVGNTLMKMVNSKWAEYLQQKFNIASCLELEFETHYSPFFMPTIRGQEVGSKKRYVGRVSSKGSDRLVFKGMETVRSDWTEIAKEYQQDVIEALFNGVDVKRVTQQYIDKIIKGEVDNKLIYKKRLGKPLEAYTKNIPPQVRAAKAALDAGWLHEVKKGMQVPYYLSLSGPKYAFRDNFDDIDYHQYIDKQILPIYLMLPNTSANDFSVDGQQSLSL